MKLWSLFTLVLAIVMMGCSSATYVRQKVPGEKLSIHKTRATFMGIETVKCRHLTTLCPDRCEHGGKIAYFRIDAYEDYQKLSDYGDPKQETFVVQIKDGQGKTPKTTSDALVLVVDDLKQGDIVNLEWIHTYVDDGFVVEPRRLVTRLGN
ncbi:MAG: hypothetical protein Q4C03_03495 [bacterium]|nr:hypothetical protein [bacterium]